VSSPWPRHTELSSSVVPHAGNISTLEGTRVGVSTFISSVGLYCTVNCWTSNCLRHHGLSDMDEYTLCYKEIEMLDHLLTGCIYRWESWFGVLRFFGLGSLSPTEESPLAVWWHQVGKSVAN
jgi:hypothetical protein